jgi:glucosyl-3-phosphoglycerate synthase
VNFSFAVIGRNEGRWLPVSLGQALEAAGPGDEVLFVDSASRDGSRGVAESLGVPALDAPAGKGNAVAAALAAARGDYVVLLDADVERTSANFALGLRRAAERSGADLVLGDFDEPRVAASARHSTRYVWPALVGELFPEAEGVFDQRLLTGFRAIRRTFPLGQLPGGFGVEAHLNLAVVAGGGSVAHTHLGAYWGPVRIRQALSHAVGDAILDLAESLGRIAAADRPAWDAWLERLSAAVVETWRAYHDGELEGAEARAHAKARIEGAASAPLPPRPADGMLVA